MVIVPPVNDHRKLQKNESSMNKNGRQPLHLPVGEAAGHSAFSRITLRVGALTFP